MISAIEYVALFLGSAKCNAGSSLIKVNIIDSKPLSVAICPDGVCRPSDASALGICSFREIKNNIVNKPVKIILY